MRNGPDCWDRPGTRFSAESGEKQDCKGNKGKGAHTGSASGYPYQPGLEKMLRGEKSIWKDGMLKHPAY